jgi:hypothetical protein
VRDPAAATSITGLNYAAAPPPEATNLVAVAAGFDYRVGLREDGSIIEWTSGGLNPSRLPSSLALPLPSRQPAIRVLL